MRVNVKPKGAAAAVAKAKAKGARGAAAAASAGSEQQKKRQQPKKQQGPKQQQQSRESTAAVPRRRGAASNGRKTGGRGSEAKAAATSVKADNALTAAAASPPVPMYDSDDSYEHHVIDLRDDQYRGADARDVGGLALRDTHNSEEVSVDNGNGREESGSDMDANHANGHVYLSNGKTSKHRKTAKGNGVAEERANGGTLRPSKHSFVTGQLVWAKYARFPWWPALVMDHRGSLEGKGGKPSADTDVLVRFFGTYDYGWIDPFVNLSDFEVKHAERSRPRKKALQKGVEEAKEFQSTKKLPDKWDPVYDKSQNGHSNALATTGVIQSQDELEVSPNTDVEPKERKTPRKRKPKVLFEEEGIVERKPQRTLRRLRVMRQLGLAAPAGSPFSTD
ncbi:unnamed protein product [Calypogeia fissa]